MNDCLGTARRTLRAALPVIVLLLVGPATLAVDGPLDTFLALEERLVDLQEEYAESTGEHGARDGKATDPTSDPRLAILKQMDELVDATGAHEDGAEIAIGTFFWSWNLDLDLGRLYGRFDRIVDRYADHPGLDDVLAEAPAIALSTKQVDEWVAGLNRVGKVAKRAEARTGAKMSLGRLYLGARRLAESGQAFRSVLNLAGDDKELAALAEGYLFEVEHLQVGMVAPDFSAKTLAGETVSLASLRGRAVLLNFWASW